MATLQLGYYTPSSLAIEIDRAMSAADTVSNFTVSITRTSNAAKITITSSSGYLKLLFLSGPRTASNVALAAGFLVQDYESLTGSIAGPNTAGYVLETEYAAYNYLSPEMVRNVFGVVNVSASGDKEAVVWSTQKYFQFEFRYEPEAKVMTDWRDFLTWCILQRPIECIPDQTLPATFYEATLETTDADGKGLAYKMIEMLPDFPFNYRTGTLKFRQKVSV